MPKNTVTNIFHQNKQVEKEGRLTQGSQLLLNTRESMQARAFGMSFHFFLCLWNHFVRGLSLLSLITAPSPGLYRFFSKCEILPWNILCHDSPWVWPRGLCNFCSLLQCKQEKESKPQFLQCAACVQETDGLGSISGTCIASHSRQQGRGH